ncbi:MAG TPA: hypothetical protein PK156_45135, partial [Polyangium sp.]|nr:hypothetical protein [Polyangium sp.]
MTNPGLSRRVTLLGAALGLVTASCGSASMSSAVGSSPAPTVESWRHAKHLLADMAEQANRPRTMRIALALREPISGRTLESRGA